MTATSRLIVLGGLCLLPLLLGCDGNAPSGEGALVTFDTVCDKGNEGKRVALEGFLDFPDKFNVKGSSVVLRLQAAPTRTSKAIGASVRLNAGTNTVMAPRNNYNEKDLKAVTFDGKSISYTTRVKIVGVMSYSNSLDSLAFKCLLMDTRIEVAGAVAGK